MAYIASSYAAKSDDPKGYIHRLKENSETML
jgi:hypothetical protein